MESLPAPDGERHGDEGAASGPDAGAGPGTALTPTQVRLLALLRRPAEPLVFDEQFIAQLQAEATAEMERLSTRLGGERLRFNKGRLASVHGCEVKHLLPDDFRWTPTNAAGFVAHKAIELALNWRREPIPTEVVDEALARLGDLTDNRGRFVAGLSDGDWAELRSKAVDRTTKFLQDFPPLPRESHPVLEASGKWHPTGVIELTGKVDLAVGKPYGRESRILIVDFKTGGHSPTHRDDLRFYALVETLRHGVPPRKVATYYLDYADSDAEDVTEGLLESTLVRTVSGLERHIELTVEGRPPVKRVGAACRWCSLRADCLEGSEFVTNDLDTLP